MSRTISQEVAKETPWYRIEVDAFSVYPKVILVSRWYYRWLLGPGVTTPWVEREKKFYHDVFNLLLADAFRNTRIRMTATDRGFTTTLGVDFSIGRGLQKHRHWTVLLRKVHPTSESFTYQSKVMPHSSTIHLDTADIKDYQPTNVAGKTGIHNAIPHEFLHAIGYHHDESHAASPYLADTNSIMNVGKQIRERHLRHVLADLEDMVPDARFSLA
ncbi:hypothetical protein [Planctomycetes bacterium TBK1r]|uniref:Peptidase metallopeptidase domain-containing protein n=1 Tax=Stieleria magnilauensis TaxID=2527963 RepID=A0ABX5XQQ7_9BACT|nr:hypothetical protein TBK1r_31210 [Planctomycetes bacterium TBK1r]